MSCRIRQQWGASNKAIERETFDIILIDVQMPTMDGVKATLSIRKGKTGLQNKDIQIVDLTAYAMAGERDSFLQTGMNDYLTKPLDFDQLQRVLQAATERLGKRI